MAKSKSEGLPFEIKTFVELLNFCEKSYGEKAAFSFSKRKDVKQTVTFSQFKKDVNAVQKAFLKTGLSSESIALISENSYEWIVTYFACVCMGSVAVALDKELSSSELCTLMKRSGCKAVFYSKSYAQKTENICSEYGEVIKIPSENLLSLAQDALSDESVFESAVNGNTLASIVFTSGTTGESKGVMLTHENLISDTLAAAAAVEWYKKCLLVLPAHHTFGLVASILTPLIKGCETYICSSIRKLMKDIASFKPEVIIVVPVMAETIYKKIWISAEKEGKADKLRRGIKISNTLRKIGIDKRRKIFKDVLENFGGALEGIVCGGASIDEECVKGFCDIGIEFLSGYGITECSPIVCVNTVQDNEIGSVGPLLMCNEVRVVNRDENGIGDIEVKGANVMSGYLDDEEATKETFDGDWFITGDRGRIDKKGHLFLTGRKKNLIILSNGKNVSPEELESKLIHYDVINEIIVYEKDGKITAEIYPGSSFEKDEAKKLIDEALGEFNKTVPAYKNIEKIVVRDEEFPKTTTMKIKRKYQKQGEKVNV